MIGIKILRRYTRLIKRFLFRAYYLPEFYFNPYISFKKFLLDFKFKNLFSMLFNSGIGVLVALKIISGEIGFRKYGVIIKKTATNISPINNTVVFNFTSRYPLLALGNVVISNQFIRLWIKENPGHYIVFSIDHLPRVKPMVYDIISMNPDIHEVWCFNYPLKLKILKRIPNVVKSFELFGQWIDVELAIQRGVEIPKLFLPDKTLETAGKYIKERIKGKKLIFTLHLREDPRSDFESKIRNPTLSTYLEFIKKIIEKYDCYIIRLGTPDLTPIPYDQVLDTISENLPYSLQCALIHESDVFIGCHSGPQITSAALGIPTFCGSYVEDREHERDKYKMRSIRTPKIADLKREVLYKKCYDLDGNRVPAGFDTSMDYRWVDNTLDELLTRFDAFLKRNNIEKLD